MERFSDKVKQLHTMDRAETSVRTYADRADADYSPDCLSCIGRQPHLRAKRVMDLVLASLGLLLSAPAWLVVAAAIKIEDGGPIFYRQRRVGQGGRIFAVLKFRSMVVDAERETGPVWAQQNDRRVTRVGRFLRATALDELPQLWNILRGDMSFVGPRPERPELVDRFRREVPNYDVRLIVKPGLTGLAQVYGRYDSPPRHKLKYEKLYLRKRSLCLDLQLIALSVWISVRGKWASRSRKL